jgi:hypothetical protein
VSHRAPALERIFVEGPEGPLEALVEAPAAPAPGAVAICCHPHPLFGGTMQNKVVHALARAAVDLGVPAVRFNFRGVGGSAGRYDHGNGECADAIAVADWAAGRFGASRLWAMGFSFGSFIAYALARERGAERLVVVAPPVQRFDFSTLPPPACPWLVLQGDQDELVNHDAVLEWTRKLPNPPEVALFAGADHFFHGRITELRERVRGWLERSDR